VALEIRVRRFDLDLVVRSHGWYDLPPFSWDAGTGRLAFVFLEGERPVAVRIREKRGGLFAQTGVDGEEADFSDAAAGTAAADSAESLTRSADVKGALRAPRSGRRPLTAPRRTQIRNSRRPHRRPPHMRKKEFLLHWLSVWG
jgi:hypothetical protein